MIKNSIVCSCGNILLKQYEDGKTKLRVMLVVFDETGVTVKCRRCNKDHDLPIKIEMTVRNHPKLHVSLDKKLSGK